MCQSMTFISVPSYFIKLPTLLTVFVTLKASSPWLMQQRCVNRDRSAQSTNTKQLHQSRWEGQLSGLGRPPILHTLYCPLVLKRVLSHKVKVSVYLSFYVTILSYVQPNMWLQIPQGEQPTLQDCVRSLRTKVDSSLLNTKRASWGRSLKDLVIIAICAEALKPTLVLL